MRGLGVPRTTFLARSDVRAAASHVAREHLTTRLLFNRPEGGAIAVHIAALQGSAPRPSPGDSERE
jgi:hypothetical protein